MFCFLNVLSTLQLLQAPLRRCCGVGCLSQAHPILGEARARVYRMAVRRLESKKDHRAWDLKGRKCPHDLNCAHM